MHHESRIVRYAGKRTRVRQWRGQDSSRTFVLVHGIGVSSRTLEPLGRALVEHGEVILLDLPGFGGLPQPRHRLSIEGFADVVADAIEVEGVTNPVLVGHSMGAQVVTQTLLSHLDGGAGLDAVLIGPVIDPDQGRWWQAARNFVASTWYEPNRLTAVAGSGYLRAGPAWIAEVLPALVRYPMAERVAQLSSRTLVIRGEHDRLAPAAWCQAVAAAIGPATAVTLDGASHGVIWNRSEEIAELIATHLGRRE